MLESQEGMTPITLPFKESLQRVAGEEVGHGMLAARVNLAASVERERYRDSGLVLMI